MYNEDFRKKKITTSNLTLRLTNWADVCFVFSCTLNTSAVKPAWAHITANLNMLTNTF